MYNTNSAPKPPPHVYHAVDSSYITPLLRCFIAIMFPPKTLSPDDGMAVPQRTRAITLRSLNTQNSSVSVVQIGDGREPANKTTPSI